MAHWNLYLATEQDSEQLTIFLQQADWFVSHETRIGPEAGGWPVALPSTGIYAGKHALSAQVQGYALAILLRAYHLTGQEQFLLVAHRAAHTFELDILDGGVSAPLGPDGVCFEELALYPASHALAGWIIGLLGLSDYLAETHKDSIEQLIQHTLMTLQHMLLAYDTGFWTYHDLLQRALTTPGQLDGQIALLESLSIYPEADFCSTWAKRWKGYLHAVIGKKRATITRRLTNIQSALWQMGRKALFPRTAARNPLRVCVPIPAFPFTGGMLTVLEKVSLVTQGIWQMEYLTRSVGEQTAGMTIRRFGTPRMSPAHLPFALLYVTTGCSKLLALLRQGANYHVVMPQDGAYTAAFSGLAAKIAGVRVVCMDHGHLTLRQNRAHRAERLQALAHRSWLRRALIGHIEEACYWPFYAAMTHIAARVTDHYLVPGLPGDGVEAACARLGVPLDRITRFDSMVEIERHFVLDLLARTHERQTRHIAPMPSW
ncbi:D-glucuronyl C5-epimerase family protein [Dictyobacter kobayashii]|uniref:D-glucuronyl C5-epimerase C-terminal domain-containing protein n=1 Tax=Dictyobacter kobayashii TaxID=2014872 RepID=A0A402APK1_9CHLR|nr:D-glucuronyl C5-epimerase family protein [Dictyobacter kobayashii]GCE20959.1 hypothetical protein KDK_47590 [Dictyobacter kobayashii]